MKNKHFETLAVRTQTEKTNQKEHSTPLFLTSSFTFDSAEEGAALFKGTEEVIYTPDFLILTPMSFFKA